MSVNHYHRWSPEPGRLSDWVKWSGRPFPDSEWHAMEFDRADIEVEGAGFRVRAQRDRGLFCQDTAIGPLRQPGCVGRHWFRYGGDSDARSAGLVDRQYRPHTEMTEVMQAIDGQVCPLAEFLSTTPDG